MTPIMVLLIGIIFANGSVAYPLVQTLGTCEGDCFYDPVKNASTNGYDPQWLFLNNIQIKLDCQHSHVDLAKVGLPDLGYCSKTLGTL